MELLDKIEKEANMEKKKPYIKILLTLMSIFIVGLIYFYLSPQKNPTHSNSNGNFTFKSVQNREFNVKVSKNHINIAELKGKIVFLKVFGWDCKYCQKEIPELIKLKEKFKVAFDVIAIEAQHHSMNENLEFIKKHNINYNILEGDKHTAFLDYLKNEYSWTSVIPITLVIDGNGKILAFEAGYKSYNLTTLLQTTLRELTTVAENKKDGGN